MDIQWVSRVQLGDKGTVSRPVDNSRVVQGMKGGGRVQLSDIGTVSGPVENSKVIQELSVGKNSIVE